MPPPVLWHISFSNYNEKARWALDFKGVEYRLKEAPPGLHPLWARRLGGGRTFPLLVIDGQAIGDSTRIIEELERRHPDPPLYPRDAAERSRALELEDYFDEELGPYIRRMAYHHLTADPELLGELAMHQVQYGHRATLGITKQILNRFLDLRFSTASPERARDAEEKVILALDRLDSELEGREYLVGDRFSVADLTAAALLYPFVLPPQTPWRPTRLPEPWIAFNEEHRGRHSHAWVEEMYRRHRGPG
jgi:glutathione S-transferase